MICWSVMANVFVGFFSIQYRVFPRNNNVWAHGPMSLKFDGPFL